MEFPLSNRKDVIQILQELCAAYPDSLYSAMSEAQKGTGFVLGYLIKANGEVIAGDLAKELEVSTARIAVLLRKMEKNGLIMRHRSSQDARRTVVEITPMGIERANELRERIVRKAELLLEKVGKEELEEFIRVSRKIKAAMED